MHYKISCVHWHNHYKQVAPSRVVCNYSCVKNSFYPCDNISNEQFVYNLIINQVRLGQVRCGPIVRISKLEFKETTQLRTLYRKKEISSREIIFQALYLVKFLKLQAYWIDYKSHSHLCKGQTVTGRSS